MADHCVCPVLFPLAHNAAVDRTSDQAVQQQPGRLRGLNFKKFCCPHVLHCIYILHGHSTKAIEHGTETVHLHDER